MYTVLKYGRVKIAGNSIKKLYNICEDYVQKPSSDTAVSLVQSFHHIRKNPPAYVKSSYFPKKGSSLKKICKNSPAIIRPLLSTNQGTGGEFSMFEVTKQDQITNNVLSHTSKLVIPEKYFQENIINNPKIKLLHELVIQQYSAGLENECFLTLQKLEILCEQKNFLFKRKANKGRSPFFFVRPSSSAGGFVQIPQAYVNRIHQVIMKKLKFVMEIAEQYKKQVAETSSLPKINQIKFSSKFVTSESFLQNLLYFQCDVVIKKDGSFVIMETHFPDLAFFLTQVTTGQSDIFANVQKAMQFLFFDVGKVLAKEFRVKTITSIYLLTRDEVLDNNEDILEILEIKAFVQKLKSLGFKTIVCKQSQIDKIPNGSTVLTLNIFTHNRSFNKLLIRSAKNELFCYPDPFIHLFKHQLHTMKECKLNDLQIQNIYSIIGTNYLNNEEGCFRRLLALKEYLSGLGFGKEEVFYIYNTKGRYAPAFLYDLHGFKNSLKIMSKNNKNGLLLRSLDMKPEDCIIYGKDGHRIAAFRFMLAKL